MNGVAGECGFAPLGRLGPWGGAEFCKAEYRRPTTLTREAKLKGWRLPRLQSGLTCMRRRGTAPYLFSFSKVRVCPDANHPHR